MKTFFKNRDDVTNEPARAHFIKYSDKRKKTKHKQHILRLSRKISTRHEAALNATSLHVIKMYLLSVLLFCFSREMSEETIINNEEAKIWKDQHIEWKMAPTGILVRGKCHKIMLCEQVKLSEQHWLDMCTHNNVDWADERMNEREREMEIARNGKRITVMNTWCGEKRAKKMDSRSKLKVIKFIRW